MIPEWQFHRGYFECKSLWSLKHARRPSSILPILRTSKFRSQLIEPIFDKQFRAGNMVEISMNATKYNISQLVMLRYVSRIRRSRYNRSHKISFQLWPGALNLHNLDFTLDTIRMTWSGCQVGHRSSERWLGYRPASHTRISNTMTENRD